MEQPFERKRRPALHPYYLFLQQLDSLLVLVGFLLNARLAAGIGKFLVGFDQDRGIGWGIFDVAELFPKL
jgi:hypothetical protein